MADIHTPTEFISLRKKNMSTTQRYRKLHTRKHVLSPTSELFPYKNQKIRRKYKSLEENYFKNNQDNSQDKKEW